jgi:DnaD/phage-associated family protein
MKLEQNDKSLLFSSTELPDVFFSEYLSNAKGDYIKVYLYMLFLSKYKKDVKINDLSKKLCLPFNIIQEAITYWEEQGAILKKSTGYVFCNLQEKELLNLYCPKLTSSPEQSKKIAENQYRSKAIESINSKYFQGVMSPSWYNDIDLWFRKYGFDEQVMISLFDYCFDKSALHRNYVQAVADAWSKSNIKTYTDLDSYYQKQEKLKLIKKAISQKLGFNRSLTQFEEAYIEKWLVEYGFSLSIIDIALKKTTSKANPNFDYLDKLLTDWKERGFKTAEEIQNFIKQTKEQNRNIKELEKKSGFKSYEQRSYDNLDSLYANNSN